MPEHSRDYIMHVAKSSHGTFSRPRAVPTYLPTLASDRALQKLYTMLPYFPNLLQDRDFLNLFKLPATTFSLYFHYALRSRCRKRSFSIYFRQVGTGR